MLNCLNKSMNKFPLVIILLFILGLNLFLINNQVLAYNDQSDYLSYKYKLNVNIEGNTTLASFAIRIGFRLIQNASGIFNYTFLQLKNGCFNFSLKIEGIQNYTYTIGVISTHGSSNFSRTFANYTCDLFSYFTNQLEKIFNLSNQSQPNLKNSTPISTNYTSRMIYNGLEYYSGFPSINYTYILNYSSLYRSNTSLVKINYKLNSTLLNSLDYGFPVYVKSNLLGYYNVSSNTHGISTQLNSNKLKISSIVSLFSTNLKPSTISNYKVLNLNTSTGVNLILVSNKTVEEVNVLGNQMNVTLTGNGNASITLLYGSPSLLVNYENIKLISPLNLTMYKFFYLSYALIYLKTNSNSIIINLGSNVGSLSYKSQNFSNLSNYIYYLIAAIVVVAIAVGGFIYVKRRKLRLK